jgi:hypothetical protein
VNFVGRIAVAVIATAFTLFMLTTLISIFSSSTDTVSLIVSLPLGALVTWWCWRATEGKTLGIVGWIVAASLITGAMSFSISLGVILVFIPEANQGPMFAVFIAGPGGVIVGAAVGFVIWLKKEGPT